MTRKRNRENLGLPARWVNKHGAYYYLPPVEQRAQWDGKSWFLLGKSLQEAYRAWAERMPVPDTLPTIGALLDRYLLEVVPNKAPKTRTEHTRAIRTLRGPLGAMSLKDLEPQHVYQYFDKRQAKVAARREIEVLSHAFTKAVEWGAMRAHPFRNEVRLKGTPARTRYVEDWELIQAMSLTSKRTTGSVIMVQAYLRLKLLTGLRKGDLLRLTTSNCHSDGLHVTPGKTKLSTGKRIIYEWTPDLRAAIDGAIAVRPSKSSFLFCNRFGRELFDESKGTTKGFDHIWQGFIARVLKETEVTERFTEHDLRAKVGSDAENLERARQLLSHSDARMTEAVYRRKPERIQPTN